MASVWIEKTTTKNGKRRYRVRFRIGGGESAKRYGGSFSRKDEAIERKLWISGELAAMRIPDLRQLVQEHSRMPALREARDVWRTSRIDVAERTRINDRVNTDRIFTFDKTIEGRRLDDMDGAVWAAVFADLAAAVHPQTGTRRFRKSTLKKSKEAFAMIYDHYKIVPNPLRDSLVKLPYEREKDLIVPLAIHVEAVAAVLDPKHLLPYLVIDWTGLRIGAIGVACVRDLDELRGGLLARASVAKNARPIWVELHEVLFDAVVADLPPREDRDLSAPLFPGFVGANLRMAIARACRLTGTPHFTPHGLRRRRGSLLSKQGYSLAEVAERLGDTQVVTAKHYLFALGDYTEVDYRAALARLS
jgi:integrase